MKKYLLFVLMAVSLISISCKSTEQETVSEVLTPAQLNERLLTQIENSRSLALNAGADKFYADQFKAIDADLKKLKNMVNGSEEDFSDELSEINYRYFILNRACALRKDHKK